ncbi:beta-lactamase family protein [Flavobacteriaceae bacterium]|nr:beta-lactamase family protein [Flavobacteriaceae bacterium]MDC3354486.1 beta-lactamase family protein [Flavobacteriaceae bacterium]
MKKFFQTLGLVLITLFGLLYISDYNYLLTAVSNIYLKGHTTAFLSDYNYFDNRVVPPSENPEPWPLHKDFNTKELSPTQEQINFNNKTVAFLILKNDSLYFEKYYEDYGIDSKSNAFSMAKSYVAALLGKAIMEGYIKSLDQPVIDFIPELKGEFAQMVTVGDLASMASGQKWDEAYYSPTSVTTAAYFVKDLDQLILDQPIDQAPGKSYIYKSGTTQLLGMVIAKATGKTLSDYLYESFWNPMGAEHEALWQLDSAEKGMEKAYCCIASNARDFARLSKLYKNHGKWNGKILLDSTFIAKSIQPRFPESPEYGYSWWLKNYKGHEVFMNRGHLGQYVLTFPKENLILVRLGRSKGVKGDPEDPFTPDLYRYMDLALEMNPDASTP